MSQWFRYWNYEKDTARINSLTWVPIRKRGSTKKYSERLIKLGLYSACYFWLASSSLLDTLSVLLICFTSGLKFDCFIDMEFLVGTKCYSVALDVPNSKAKGLQVLKFGLSLPTAHESLISMDDYFICYNVCSFLARKLLWLSKLL